MNFSKCIAIIAGTQDIYHPLKVNLSSELQEPVFLLESLEPMLLAQEIKNLIEEYEVWILPSNEITLNLLNFTLKYIDCSKNKLFIPGTASKKRIFNSYEISNKSILIKLIGCKKFDSFKIVKTIQINSYTNIFDLEEISFPIVIKPAQKDSADTFAKNYPSKVHILSSFEELNIFLRDKNNKSKKTKFIAQELIHGQCISWCGFASKNTSSGYEIISQHKSPSGEIGGTTTLAKLNTTRDCLKRAVNELMNYLQLEGIFEVEFILKDNDLYFFYEINPRPWLQVSLVLQQDENVFVQYFINKGFNIKSKNKYYWNKCNTWGSASRYLQLNLKNSKFSWKIFILSVIYDVQYSQFYSFTSKIAYTYKLLILALKKLGL